MSRTDKPRTERDDHFVQASQTPRFLRHDLRLKAAVAVPWRLDLDRPVIGAQRLRGAAVARFAGPSQRRAVRLAASDPAAPLRECPIVCVGIRAPRRAPRRWGPCRCDGREVSRGEDAFHRTRAADVGGAP